MPRLIHVALWIACTFLLYAAYQLLMPSDHDESGWIRLNRIIAGFDGLVYGAALACCLILFYRRCHARYNLAQVHPGHCIAIELTVLQATGLIVGFVRHAEAGAPVELEGAGIQVGDVLILLVPVSVLVAAIYLQWQSLIWRLFFVLEILALVSAFSLLLLLGREIPISPPLARLPDFMRLACLVVIVTAVIKERSTGKLRDWIHYAGCAAYSVMVAWTVLFNLFNWWLAF